MKMIQYLFLVLITISMSKLSTGQNDADNNTPVIKDKDVQVYYFHNTRRCATCKAVEAESKKAVKELYGDKVLYESYNLEETKGEEKAEELDVSGQTLLIVSGDKKINITNEGFLNARSNPEKFKQIIKSKIDPLLQ